MRKVDDEPLPVNKLLIRRSGVEKSIIDEAHIHTSVSIYLDNYCIQ